MNAHADASPSSSSIWIKCPASVTKARGKRRAPTVYTTEGQAAHEVADMLIHGLPAPDTVTCDGVEVEVSEGMVDAVERYVGYVETRKAGADIFRTESVVTVPVLGGEKLYGTADVVAYDRVTENLEIVDLKYGRGVAVSAVNNPQLRIYALGAVNSIGAAYPIDTVQMTIIQPRTENTPGQNTEMIDVTALYAWRDTILFPAIVRIDADDQTETPGDHCRWCVRAGECSALANLAQYEARMTFDQVTTGLTNDDLAEILNKAELVQAWIAQVQAEASQRLDHGQTIPGWKLVAKKGMEKWTDHDAALDELRHQFSDIIDEMVKLRTPAQVKRVLKSRKYNENTVGALTNRESTGTTLARDEDPRPGVHNDAKSVFEQLTESLEEGA